jgi:hypothetical protein
MQYGARGCRINCRYERFLRVRYPSLSCFHALPCMANRQGQALFSDNRTFRDLYSYRRHVHAVNAWCTSWHIRLGALRAYLGSCRSRSSAEGILQNRASRSFHRPLSADGVATRDCGQAFVCQDACSWPVLIVCGRFVVHRRCSIFCNRYAGTIWPSDLASICYCRHHLPLFLSPLVCGLTINLDESAHLESRQPVFSVEPAA